MHSTYLRFCLRKQRAQLKLKQTSANTLDIMWELSVMLVQRDHQRTVKKSALERLQISAQQRVGPWLRDVGTLAAGVCVAIPASSCLRLAQFYCLSCANATIC